MAYKENGRVDLHIHSTASDGTLSPPEIIRLAVKLNLGAISITDHDTMDGAKEALLTGIPPAIKFLTGVEVSTSAPLTSHASAVCIYWPTGYGWMISS